MNEKNIFKLKNKKTDLFAGMPYEDALAFIEQSNFKLLLSNNHIGYFGEKNHRIYYHEKSGIILKANNDKSNKLEDINIYYQIEANYQPEVWDKFSKLEGDGDIAPTGYGTWVAGKHVSFREVGFVKFLEKIQKIYNLYPNAFYKESPISTVYLNDCFLVENYKNIDLKNKRLNTFLQAAPPELKGYFNTQQKKSSSPKWKTIYWNELLYKNIRVNNLNELAAEDKQIVSIYKKIINAKELLDIEQLNLKTSTSVGINILHTLPFITNNKNTKAVLEYLNEEYSKTFIQQLANNPDNFGETPFFTALKANRWLGTLEDKENNYDLLTNYIQQFGQNIQTFNDKESISNIIIEGKHHLNTFLMIKEFKLEWWHRWHEKDNINTQDEKILRSTNNPEEILERVAFMLPEKERIVVYDDYYSNIKEQLNKAIKEPLTQNKPHKI